MRAGSILLFSAFLGKSYSHTPEYKYMTETVSIISNDPPFKDSDARFTHAILKTDLF